jgi:hypothetical protein
MMRLFVQGFSKYSIMPPRHISPSDFALHPSFFLNCRNRQRFEFESSTYSAVRS